MITTENASMTAQKPVCFITGSSSGFGPELAQLLLKRGYRTVLTTRNPDKVAAIAALGTSLVFKMDVTDRDTVDAAIKGTEAEFGSIDILINNAGIGYFAAVEESEEYQVRKMFEINVYGVGRMIHSVLPGMRERRSGFIVNFSSIAGLRSSAALGYYNATKYAVEGLTEALWLEVEPLGIKVMLVEPSSFRTDWEGRLIKESKKQISDYAETAGVWRDKIRTMSDEQQGDPVSAALAIVNAIESPHPPHHLLLGSDAYESAMAKLEDMLKDFSRWEDVSRTVGSQVDPKGFLA